MMTTGSMDAIPEYAVTLATARSDGWGCGRDCTAIVTVVGLHDEPS